MTLWVYHGPTVSAKSQAGETVTFRDGQYFMMLNQNFGQNYTEVKGNVYSGSKWHYCVWSFAQSTSSSTTSIGFFGGRLTYLWQANSRKWGSHNYHAASGGNYYTLRSQTGLVNSSGGRTKILPAGYKVIIGRGQGFYNSGRTAIRCWGYRDTNGVVHETTGQYVQELSVTSYPTNYRLNTI